MKTEIKFDKMELVVLAVTVTDRIKFINIA